MAEKRKNIKTTHELARTLIETGQLLLELPDIPISEMLRELRKKKKETKIREEVRALIDRLEKGEHIEDKELEEELLSFTLEELKVVCRELNIPFRRKRKADVVRMIISALRTSRELKRLREF